MQVVSKYKSKRWCIITFSTKKQKSYKNSEETYLPTTVRFFHKRCNESIFWDRLYIQFNLLSNNKRFSESKNAYTKHELTCWKISVKHHQKG